MTKLFKWLLPKKVDIPEIKPVLLSDVQPAVLPPSEITEELRVERRRFVRTATESDRTASGIRQALLRQTLERHVRGVN